MQVKDLMFRPGLMKGQRILITGGGTGLGRVMAEAFVMLGAEVAIAGRRSAVLEATAAQIVDCHGGTVLPVMCDITNADDVDAALETVWNKLGPLTGLVNNAAGNFISRTEDLSPRGFDAIANIVFRGSFLMTAACGKRWIKEGNRASVISILTTWIRNGSPFVVPSAMSKAGVAAMTKSLAVEWGSKGIRFNAIAPGPFPTEGMEKRLNPGGNNSSFDGTVRNPIGRVGRMPELANLAIYLLHPGSEYLNGEVIAIDGGEYLATGGNFSELRHWTDEQWREARDSIRQTDNKDKAGRNV